MTEDPKPRQEGDESLFGKVMSDSLKGKVKNFVGDLKIPKELVAHMMTQVDETKKAAVGIVAREVREFLEQTDLAEEISKVLTKVDFEITTRVRFKPRKPSSPDK